MSRCSSGSRQAESSRNLTLVSLAESLIKACLKVGPSGSFTGLGVKALDELTT